MWWLVVLSALASTPADVQAVTEASWRLESAHAFTEAVNAPHRDVRIAALRAIGRLRDSDGLAMLSEALDDPDPQIRREAAWSIGFCQTTPDIILNRLIVERDPTVRVALISSLGRLGSDPELPALEALTVGRQDTSAAALRAIGRLARRGVDARAARETVVGALSRPDPRVRSAAAYALSRMTWGEQRGPAKDALMASFRLPDPVGRARVIAAIWKVLTPEERVRAVSRISSDPAHAVAIVIGVMQPDQIPMEWTQSRHPALRWAVVARAQSGADLLQPEWRTLGKPTFPSESEEPDVLSHAMQAATSADDITTYLTHIEPRVRTAAAARWLELQEDSTSWKALLTNEDSGLRALAVKSALDRHSSVIPVVFSHLESEDGFDVWITVADWLARQTEPVEIPPELSSHATRFDSSLIQRVFGPPIQPKRPLEVKTQLGQVEVVRRTIPQINGQLDQRVIVETTQGTFVIELDRRTAPLAAENFAELVQARIFDGMRWHRVIPGFVAQTGCPRGDGTGGPGWTITDEVSDVRYSAGSVGMARDTSLHTGGSQWFVTTVETPHLVGDYTRFGTVTQGLDVVKLLVQSDRIVSARLEP